MVVIYMRIEEEQSTENNKNTEIAGLFQVEKNLSSK